MKVLIVVLACLLLLSACGLQAMQNSSQNVTVVNVTANVQPAPVGDDTGKAVVISLGDG